MTERREKKLLDCVRDAIRTKHYSIRTEEAHVNWIKCFILLPKSLWNKRKGAETKAGGIGKNNKSQSLPDLRRRLALNVSCSLTPP